MDNLVREVSDLANDILESWGLTQFEALQIAVQIQRNRVLSFAHVVTTDRTDGPSALESIAIELREYNANAR